ncbi:MAG: hypothetical protein MZV63_65050 [Marinilabiliales bacterium]|nr:hypothetical protein [Marinilabiliales bacterium]
MGHVPRARDSLAHLRSDRRKLNLIRYPQRYPRKADLHVLVLAIETSCDETSAAVLRSLIRPNRGHVPEIHIPLRWRPRS